MAIYRGEGGKTDVVPDSGDYEFAGSIIVEKDAYVGGDLHVEGDINGNFTGNGSGLENVPTPFLQADDCIYLNNQVITNDYTMPVGKNGMTAGDITVNGTVEIPDGSDWHIIGNDDGVVTLETLGIPNHDLVTVTSDGDIVNVTSLSVEGDITSSSGVFTGDGSGLYNVPMGDAYTKSEVDAQQQIQDEAIQNNADAIAAIPGAVDAYTKAEIDVQQSAQDTKIDKNTADIAAIPTSVDAYTKAEVDASQAAQDAEIDKKLEDAPTDGEQYVRKGGVWAELAAADGGIADAPADGKTYGRKDLKWEEVTSDAYTETETDALLNDKADKADTYTKTEVDATQKTQDDAIADNATNIATNTTDIAKNATDIESLTDDIDALTGSIIYKGSLNATVTPAPADAVEGDMYINEYNVDEPATNYPVASGWAPVTEVKYDDKLIKTDTGWDLIASVVGVPTYTAGEIDVLLDDKANKDEVYTKTESDTLLDDKANVGDSYTKAESDTALDLKADKATTYTKTEVDSSQALQNTEIAKKANQDTTYTKDEVDELLESASGAIVGNYTNKWASSVARDPGAGNLYLVQGMSFTAKFEDATRIYISDTDGDGALRNFDEVKVDDVLTVTSDNGQGVFKLMSISDLTGYRELVLEAESASGTVANDTAVSLILDVASSETGGGIEEAPEDGKQYARQDGDWSEVTGGGSTPTPEALVWEDELANRAFNTVYTNDKKAPLYLHLNVWNPTAFNNYTNLFIDGKDFGLVGGSQAGDGRDLYQSNFFIIPEGSTYELKDNSGSILKVWQEAKMPLAIAVGGASSGGTTDILPVLYSGSVVADGTIDKGTGFTVTKTDTGRYTVVLDKPVADKSSVGASVNFRNSIIQTKVNSSTEVEFLTFNLDNAYADVSFDFTVTGTETIAVGGGSGGGEVTEKEAVVFKMTMGGNKQVIPNKEYTPVEFGNYPVDTSNSCADSKFSPKVAGYYHINALLESTVNSAPIRVIASVSVKDKDGNTVPGQAFKGNDVLLEPVEGGKNLAVTCGGVVYLNGDGDYVMLQAYIQSSNGEPVEVNTGTILTGHLITGQSTGGGSASGDTIWTEEGSTATYSGNIDVNNINSNNIVANRLDMTGGSSSVTAEGTLYLHTKSDTNPIKLGIGGTATENLGFSVGADKRIAFNGYKDNTHDNSGFANMYMSASGIVYKSNATTSDKRTHLSITNHEKLSVDTSGILTAGPQLRLVGDSSNKIIGNQTLYLVGGGDTRIHTGGDVANPHTRFIQDGRVVFAGYDSGEHTSAGKPNMYMSAGGTLFRSTATTYTADEVESAIDKKLAIKDKLIEKLSARLDKLEKRVK
jgi:hypothetical protein